MWTTGVPVSVTQRVFSFVDHDGGTRRFIQMVQAHVVDESHRTNAGCPHLWAREHAIEDGLRTVVYVRSCARCGQLEAKAGHKDPTAFEGWELIEGGPAKLKAVGPSKSHNPEA
jgi:hypothetical protein